MIALINITDSILTLVRAILQPAFSVLPTSSIGVLSGDMTALNANLYNFGKTAAAYGGSFVDMGFIINTLVIVLRVLIPGIAIYKTANWIYKHIPQIGGFGPGSG